MVRFFLNGEEKVYSGDGNRSLLNYLRDDEHIYSVKDGCSAQASCGACMVELNGKPALSCVTKMNRMEGKSVTTIEGFPEKLKTTLAHAFVKNGAVQCGFCTPGFLTRTKILLQENENPTREEITAALKQNICRCTGYNVIIDAVLEAATALREGKPIELSHPAKTGTSEPKYDAVEKALGQSPFVDDLYFEGMLFGALKFSDHPRAVVKKIDTSIAEKTEGVVRIFTADDIPGKRYNGHIFQDWPVMIKAGETTRYIGDVLALVVAKTEDLARKAVKLIEIDYEILEPITDVFEAMQASEKVHPEGPMKEKGNLLENCIVQRGNPIDEVIRNSAFSYTNQFETQRVEHAFLETETAVCIPEDDGLKLFSGSQGVYVDRELSAEILSMPKEKIKVQLVPIGGGFGGKEDLTVQPHALIACYHLKKPVKVHLTRPESLRMHPKRHPIFMEYTIACDEQGKFTAMKARIVGDTGAYASVGTKVLERAAGHATGAYHFDNVDLTAKTVYTNNLPCGAFRGFGANQAIFALEGCIDELCKMGNFDRYAIRHLNALRNGSKTSTGQVLFEGVSVVETLEAVKPYYDEAVKKNQKFGLACAIKNCGVGNGMVDDSRVKVEVRSENEVYVHHGWTEMGQGANTIAVQVVSEEAGIDPEIIRVLVDTEFEAEAGMTTSSRGTSLLGNAAIIAAKKLKEALKSQSLSQLSGQFFEGYWRCDWTTKPGDKTRPPVTHYSYSFATQLVLMNEVGGFEKVIAAHDAGKIMNPALFKSQIQGSVHMGIGHAMSEEILLEKGHLVSDRFRKLGIWPIEKTPEVEVIGIEIPDPFGPYGAKGVGEVGLVPTPAAVANAVSDFDGKRYTRLPIEKDRK